MTECVKKVTGYEESAKEKLTGAIIRICKKGAFIKMSYERKTLEASFILQINNSLLVVFESVISFF
ncbi:hypothetical protein RV11_GL000308 [Enterococcus phoeniculicola]|jgi:hypothetical protein|nr:hypothetical protein RV11_GL000308 [Enterococcus phoeniculicola]